MTVHPPLTLAALMTIMPIAHARARYFIDPLRAAMDEYTIDTPARIAAFMAQVAHESGQLMYTREVWGPTAAQRKYDTRVDLGNTRPEAVAIAQWRGDTPGHLWRGAGLIQITGYDNTLTCSLGLFGDDRLVLRPELLEAPALASRSAAWFWRANDLNTLADVGDFRGITRRINGGYNGWADRVIYYTRAKALLGMGGQA